MALILQGLKISDELDNLLGIMCEDDQQTRTSLDEVLEFCQTFARGSLDSNKHFATIVRNMHRLVMGSSSHVEDLNDSSEDDVGDEREEFTQRSRPRNRSSSSQKRTKGERSQSRSR